MTESTFWGALLTVYIIGWWLWMDSNTESIEIRKKLYPGRQEEHIAESRQLKIGLGFIGGLVVILLLWYFRTQ